MIRILLILGLFPYFLCAQQKINNLGIELYFSPSLSKTSTTNINDIGDYFVKSKFGENGANYPILSYSYGYGIFYSFNKISKIELSYISSIIGQSSGKQITNNGQNDYFYLLKLKRYTNEIALNYTQKVKSFKKIKKLDCYLTGGFMINFSHKYSDECFTGDNILSNSPSSYGITNTYREYAMMRLGINMGGGLSYPLFTGVSFKSGIKYKFYTDAFERIDNNSPKGIANVLEWENSLLVSLF